MVNRRSFLKSAVSSSLLASDARVFATPTESSVLRLKEFGYQGVALLDGPMLTQVKQARDLYFGMINDDVLRGFRRAAGLPAPGNDMLGWARRDCSATFGQWISGMARLSRATSDSALREKAIELTTEWEKTLGADGNARMGTYAWEKMSCGLVDLGLYADYSHAWEILDRITQWASRNFDRSRSNATEFDRDGRRPHGTLEWYTLPENSLRAYAATGNKPFLDFARLWYYADYWEKFLTSPRPSNVALLHSYSHMNTFCGAAMAYAVESDPRYLTILRNNYDWARGTQTYASGGYGPGEWSVSPDGSLGNALDIRSDTAEIPCGTWAGFKLSRYLMGYTGEARYGDWIETLLYNGIGAALPVQPDGRSYYYADYRVGMGLKTFFWDEWPCCSGTYIQAVADYHNVLYFHDRNALYVNLLAPSSVQWQLDGQTVTLTQQTTYPTTDTSDLHLALAKSTSFALHVRVPSWCRDARVSINGKAHPIVAEPNTWLSLNQTWNNGDVVSVTFPMHARLQPVDAQHSERVAVLYGPVLMAQDARFSFPLYGNAADLEKNLERPSPRLGLRLHAEQRAQLHTGVQKSSAAIDYGGQKVGSLRPLSTFGEREPYRVHFDLNAPRFL